MSRQHTHHKPFGKGVDLTMIVPLISIALTAVSLTSCLSRAKKDPGIEDFSLGEPPQNRGMAASNEAGQGIRQNSSLPLPIRVGRNTIDFEQVPKLARNIYKSRLSLKIHQCIITIETGPVVIDQFLWTNQWVKLQMALMAEREVILEPGQYANFRATMDLRVFVPPAMMTPCRNMLSGREILLGSVHYNHSKFGIIAGPGSPRVTFQRKGEDSPPVTLYLNWPSNAQQPQLLDQFELPTSQATPIQRARFFQAGQYYLSVSPVISFKPATLAIQPVSYAH